MKATKLLKEQHEKVKTALEHLESGRGNALKTLGEVANDLAAHMAIEQQIFYPTVRAIKPELIDESYEEHSVAELALKRLLRTEAGDPAFKARVTVLKELIGHHVEEEENELFPVVERALDSAQLEALGSTMSALFTQAQAQGFAALVPEGFARTSADEFERAVSKETDGGAEKARRSGVGKSARAAAHGPHK